MAGRSFMKQASQQQDDDKFTRNDAPRTRPRPTRSATTPATTMREKADPNATPKRHRMSVTSTMLALRRPREWRSRLPAAFNIARFVIYGQCSQVIQDLKWYSYIFCHRCRSHLDGGMSCCRRSVPTGPSGLGSDHIRAFLDIRLHCLNHHLCHSPHLHALETGGESDFDSY